MAEARPRHQNKRLSCASENRPKRAARSSVAVLMSCKNDTRCGGFGRQNTALRNLLTVQHFTSVLMSCKCSQLCFPGVMDVHASPKLPQKSSR